MGLACVGARDPIPRPITRLCGLFAECLVFPSLPRDENCFCPRVVGCVISVLGVPTPNAQPPAYYGWWRLEVGLGSTSLVYKTIHTDACGAVCALARTVVAGLLAARSYDEQPGHYARWQHVYCGTMTKAKAYPGCTPRIF